MDSTDADRCRSTSDHLRPGGYPSGERRRQSAVVNSRGGDADNTGPSIPRAPRPLHQPHGLRTMETVRPLERHRMRMWLLDAVDDDRRDVEVLLTALQQAVAEVNGLGGMVHLPGGGMSGILYLVAESGLPES